jgi:magnesium chelatase family protein
MCMEAKDERRRILLVGPPGSPFIARARDLSRECKLWRGREAEQGYVYRVAGVPRAKDIDAPLRAPHHTIAGRHFIEGKLEGHMWRPGEVHLAHGGVLYLEHVAEFRFDVLDAVWSTWQSGYTRHSSQRRRALSTDKTAPARCELIVPAVFTLVMATHPCPCGWRGALGQTCTCQDRQVERWNERIAAISEGAEREELHP